MKNIAGARTALVARQSDLAQQLAWALDPVSWARDRFGFIADPWQARMLRSSSRRILLNCSRQSGKSTVTAILAAHVAIFQPGALVLLFSKAQRQSSELFAKVAAIFKSLPARPR